MKIFLKKSLISSLMVAIILISPQVFANYCTPEQIENIDPACDANCGDLNWSNYTSTTTPPSWDYCGPVSAYWDDMHFDITSSRREWSCNAIRWWRDAGCATNEICSIYKNATTQAPIRCTFKWATGVPAWVTVNPTPYTITNWSCSDISEDTWDYWPSYTNLGDRSVNAVTATCNVAISAINWVCGPANWTTVSSSNEPSTFATCTAGTVSSLVRQNPTTWSCVGSNGGTTASCSVNLTELASNGSCWSANGTSLNTAPTSNLCIDWTPSTVNDNNGMWWTWSCNGLNWWLNAWCSATKSTTPSFAGACGSSNWGSFDVAPTTNLCSYGTASAVTGSGPWSWTCYGTAGNNQSCSAQKSWTSCTNTVVYEAPVVCDINDPQLAWVCYMPSAQSTLIVSNGNVGINNMDPEYPLDINGTMRAAEVLVLSDERAKENITKIDNALEKISKVHGYTFTWKKDGHPDMWVLAQEIEKVFAEAVRTDSTWVKTVQYNALIAPILEAIKELNTIIDAHSEKAAQQANDITILEQKIQ